MRLFGRPVGREGRVNRWLAIALLAGLTAGVATTIWLSMTLDGKDSGSLPRATRPLILLPFPRS